MNKIEELNKQIEHYEWTVQYHIKELSKAEMTLAIFKEALQKEVEAKDSVDLDLYDDGKEGGNARF